MQSVRVPTPAEVERHLRRAERLRSYTLRRLVAAVPRRVGAAARGLFGAVPRPGRGDEAAALLRSPLTAMRCAAEILRDNPDLPPAERSRFLQVLLAEERRMEDLIAGLLEPRRPGAAGR